jgi:hypothetical protein
MPVGFYPLSFQARIVQLAYPEKAREKDEGIKAVTVIAIGVRRAKA